MDIKELKNVSFKCTSHCGRIIPCNYIGYFDGKCFICAKRNFVLTFKNFINAKFMSALGYIFLTTIMSLICGSASIPFISSGTQWSIIRNSFNFIVVLSIFFDKAIKDEVKSFTIQICIYIIYFVINIIGERGYGDILFAMFMAIYLMHIRDFIKKIKEMSFKLDVYARKIISTEGKDNKWGAKLIDYKNNVIKNYNLYKNDEKIKNKKIEHIDVLFYTKSQAVTDMSAKAFSLDFDEYHKEKELHDKIEAEKKIEASKKLEAEKKQAIEKNLETDKNIKSKKKLETEKKN